MQHDANDTGHIEKVNATPCESASEMEEVVKHGGTANVQGALVTLREYKTQSGKRYNYLVNLGRKITGDKRIRKQFPTASKAYAHIERYFREREHTVATHSEVTEFNANLSRLRELGVSIGQLIDFYEKRFVGSAERMRLSQVIEHYFTELESLSVAPRDRTIDTLKSQAKRIRADFADCFVDTIDPKAAVNWLKSAKTQSGKHWSGKTRKHHWTMLDCLLNEAVELKALKSNPLSEASKTKLKGLTRTESEVPEILTPKEARKLLDTTRTIYPELLPCVALAMFAGLRQTEAFQVHWADINFREKNLKIRRAVSKMRKARPVKLNETALAWLSTCEIDDGPIFKGTPVAASMKFGRLVKKAGWQCPVTKKSTWMRNALRHSYASYQLKIDDGNDVFVRVQLGHSTNNVSQLYNNYATLTEREHALEYFEIKPDSTDRTTIKFPAKAV